MDVNARQLLTRTLKVFAELSAGKVSIDVIDAAINKLGSDITDALTEALKESSAPSLEATITNIVNAIDRQTEIQEGQYKDIIAGRELSREQHRAAIEYYQKQNSRDEERVAQLRKEWAERDEQAKTPPTETWFDVDGKPCRFRAVLDAIYYLVIGEDGTHYRIAIEGAKELDHDS